MMDGLAGRTDIKELVVDDSHGAEHERLKFLAGFDDGASDLLYFGGEIECEWTIHVERRRGKAVA